MDADSDARRELARHIRERRVRMGVSGREAAKRAGIAQNTWTGAERGKQRTAEYNYAGIERALRWTPGSIEAILAGGEPRTLDEVELPADEPAGAAAAVRQIREIVDGDLAAGFSCETRLAMIRDVLDRDAPVDAGGGEGDVEPGRRRAAG